MRIQLKFIEFDIQNKMFTIYDVFRFIYKFACCSTDENLIFSAHLFSIGID